jgi:hypothetical protein
MVRHQPDCRLIFSVSIIQTVIAQIDADPTILQDKTGSVKLATAFTALKLMGWGILIFR